MALSSFRLPLVIAPARADHMAADRVPPRSAATSINAAMQLLDRHAGPSGASTMCLAGGGQGVASSRCAQQHVP